MWRTQTTESDHLRAHYYGSGKLACSLLLNFQVHESSGKEEEKRKVTNASSYQSFRQRMHTPARNIKLHSLVEPPQSALSEVPFRKWRKTIQYRTGFFHISC